MRATFTNSNVALSESLTPFLYISLDELLGIALEHLVDLIEQVVDVGGQLLDPLVDVGRRLGGDLLGLLGGLAGALLAPAVLARHDCSSPRRRIALDRTYVTCRPLARQ